MNTSLLISGKSTAAEALALIKKGMKAVPVIEETKDEKKLKGVLTSKLLMGQMHRFQFKLGEPFNANSVDPAPRLVTPAHTISEIIELLKQHQYLVLVREVSGEKSFDMVNDEDVLEAMAGASE